MPVSISDLMSEATSAIEIYRANIAVPNTLDTLRFWISNELVKIQTGFISTDEAVRALAEAIDGIDAGEGEIPEECCEDGRDGIDGRGIHVYSQSSTPSEAQAGDVWFVTESGETAPADVRILSTDGNWYSLVGPPGEGSSDDLIDDEAIRLSTTWSSEKINSELITIHNQQVSQDNLIFQNNKTFFQPEKPSDALSSPGDWWVVSGY